MKAVYHQISVKIADKIHTIMFDNVRKKYRAAIFITGTTHAVSLLGISYPLEK